MGLKCKTKYVVFKGNKTLGIGTVEELAKKIKSKEKDDILLGFSSKFNTSRKKWKMG